MRAFVIALVFATVALGARVAGAESAQFRVDGRPHVGMPFELDLLVSGFDESPAPVATPFKLANATLTALGATPNVSRSVQIINGRATQSSEVTWVLRYRVEVHKEGTLVVPETTVTQGTHTAIARAGNITVDTIPTTDEMRLALALPDRPVFVGETVPVHLVWLFRQQPEEQTFSVPLLGLDDDFVTSAPPVTDKEHAFAFATGTKELAVPYVADKTEVNGREYQRITFTFFIAPRRTGKVDVPASSVVASLAVGRRDFFGNASTRPFRAQEAAAHVLDVKPLPETDRPASFAGAVGEQFSIAVHASRSVVQLGEPVDLEIAIKSDQRLDALSLGNLSGEGGLPKDKFTVPETAPTGELATDGLTKTFKVTAQVTGPATEIPAIELAYFDPAKRTYQTIHSDPIALSVKGGTIVGADAVVTGAPRKAPAAGAALADDAALVDAQLALSTVGADDAALGGALLWILVALLYAVPLGILGTRTWQLRTRAAREDSAGVRAARRRFDAELAKARTVPARAAIGPLVVALREVAKLVGASDPAELVGALETEAFAPSAAEQPLPAARLAEVTALVDRWLGDRKRAATNPSTTAVAAIALVVLAASAGIARADQPSAQLEEGRAAYRDAMAQPDPAAKRVAFARAAAALQRVALAHDSAELYADWGNAALGAGDVGAATLAYRRALLADATNARARQNLELLRNRAPELVKVPQVGAADSLFFFHRWSRARRLLVGGGAFAVAILLLVPWRGSRRRGLVMLAVLPAAVWLAMLVSIALEDRHPNDAVVMDDAILRAADSAGAPQALAQSLPRGTEVTILERRGAWSRVQIAPGATGWVPAGTIELVTR